VTMLDTLFGLVPAASKGQQWLAEDLQLVNWGGYDGAHRVRFSPSATLLCGGSGSGKSTLMDAYIALMMPHTTPFNGASNGGVTGRPRGEEQRNILSYSRGKLDESRTEDGTQVRVLRGDGADTWTAVAMTWVDKDGARFTAVRAWYFPATARVLDDAVKVRGVVEGAYDLSLLEDAATHRLSDSAVRATGLDTMSTDKEFLARIHSVLGIGAAGAGTKAMSLLARIQAGQQITTVDELYKRMVLEEPETMAVADEVVSHFDELEGTRERMVTAQRQVKALRPIRDSRTKIEASTERLRLIDEIGRFDDPDSQAALWMNGQRLDLLHAAETEVRQQKKAVDAEVTSASVAADAAEAERDGLLEVLRHSGGDQLETAKREISQAERRLAEVTRARERFDEATACLQADGEAVDSADAFAELVESARVALADPDIKSAAMDAYVDARGAVAQWQGALRDLDNERRQVERRGDNIPAALHEARDARAEAAGLDRADLPFVGELIEVRTEYEPWRDAFNLALGGFATTILIDTEHLPEFRTAIDSVRTSRRIRYEGAQTGLPQVSNPDPGTLPGRLDYRDTGAAGFTGWLQQRLERQFGYACVDSPRELSNHSKALTITGQLSQGSRGAHGGHGTRNVLGFSNQRRLDDLAVEIDRMREEVEDAELARDTAAKGLDALDARLAAYRTVASVTWEEIDVAAVEAERDRWAGIIEGITDGNPEMDKLQEQIDQLKVTIDRLRESIGKSRGEQEMYKTRWADIADQVDAAMIALDEAADDGRELSDAQVSYLADRFGPADTPDQLATFDAAIATASRRLAEDRGNAQSTLTEQREQLRRTLENFLDNWPNPNLRADPDTSVPDFERILDDLETSGLHELETEWKNSLVTLSGNDLTNLASALSRARREIQERIEPINRIMQELPFYDDDHRLQIVPRDNQSETRRRFLKDLREVRGLIDDSSTTPAAGPERAHAYERMSRLINRIRRNAPDFDGLIDVRNHVRVSAEKITADTGEHVALYDYIGEKSGGESQELIAFIVGAALRYQLGDADAERPRYAPVFLDEALIKADAHFTKRAIGAWRGLGFQLVIGAPNDKYSAIEPHVEVEYDILKDTAGRSWARPKVGVAAP
jgi:uncharacterized protein YPO0396